MAEGTDFLRLLQMLEWSMPAHEVLHSLHTQALMVPEIRENPAMKRFSDLGEANVHAMVAAAGYIRRMLVGERSPELLTGLKEQLGVMQRTFQDAGASFQALMSSLEGREPESLRALSQVMGVATQVNQAMRPLISPLVAPEVFTDAH